MAGLEKHYPGDTGEAHPEAFITIPPQPRESKEGQLTKPQLQQFFDQGYILVENFFSAEELQPCKNDIEMLVDELAQRLYAAGKIQNLHSEYGLFQRLTKLENDFPGCNILLFKSQKMTKSFCNLWSNKRLLNVVEQIIGPNIAGHPVWNLRTKTPFSKAVEIPWHQDSAYFSNESYDHMIVTAWIPFLDATEENGCMQMAQHGHRTGRVAVHTCCKDDTWYVMLDEKDMQETLKVDLEKDIKTVPVPYRGMLLFNNIIPHRSLTNVSNAVRWSVDLRWQSPFEKWGYYDLQEGVLMRSSKEPNLKINWEKYLNVDRKEKWKQFLKNPADPADEFNRAVSGPWFSKWEIVTHNKHTENFNFKTV